MLTRHAARGAGSTVRSRRVLVVEMLPKMSYQCPGKSHIWWKSRSKPLPFWSPKVQAMLCHRNYVRTCTYSGNAGDSRVTLD